jgi:hypothetical protein
MFVKISLISWCNSDTIQNSFDFLCLWETVGKRSLHMMDTVNAKKRWTTKYWSVNKFLKKSHEMTRFAKEWTWFLKINDINDTYFFKRLTAIIVVL